MVSSFTHDSNARNDAKILRLRIRHKAAGYGVYFMLLELMRDNANHMCSKDYNAIAFALHEDAGLIKDVVENYGLFVFTDDGKYFYSESFNNRMSKSEGVSRKRRSAAAKRWGKKEGDLFEDSPDETAENIPTVTPPTPETTEIPPEKVAEDMKKSALWIESMLSSHSMDRETLFKRIDDFIIDCRCREKKHSSIADAKRHFNDWLRRQARMQGRQKAPPKTAKGSFVIPTVEEIKQQRLKEWQAEKERLEGLVKLVESNPRSSARASLEGAYRNGKLKEYGITWKPKQQ